MPTEDFGFKTYYVIARRRIGGKIEYHAINYMSGGWPWWADWPGAAKEFNTLSEASDNLCMTADTGYGNTEVFILKVEPVVTIIEPDSTEVTNARRKEAMAKLTPEERELLGLN